jgi:tetratricopeptide (TPR) repeat protein
MSGKFDAALASFEALTKDYGKSRWLMDIGETMVSIYAAKKDLANAAKSLDKLGSDASAAGVDASFDKAVQVLKGRVFEEQKDYAKARAAYGVASSASGLDARIVQLGKLGEARCTAATGDKTKAEGIFRSLVREDATNGVLAGAWNGLGDLMLEDGKKGKGDAEKITDALYCYLRGVVQYPPLPGDSTLEHERAIAGAAQCFRFLSQIDSKAEGKRANKDRADQHVAMLRQRYPNSAFLQGL